MNSICKRDAKSVLACSLEYCEALDRSLDKFWEVENYRPNDKHQLSAEIRKCEEFFEKTTARNEDDRFIVRTFFRGPKGIRRIARNCE